MSTKFKRKLAQELRSKQKTEEGRSSPDGNCPICLERIEDKSFANKCFHSFCKTCLVEWSKVKAECPVCRQTFDRIIHSVKALDDYQEQVVEPKQSFFWWSNLDGAQRQREMFFERNRDIQCAFRYPTTLTPMRRRLLELNSIIENFNNVQRLSFVFKTPSMSSHTSVTSTTHTRLDESSSEPQFYSQATSAPPPPGTSDFRRYVYSADLWVLPYGNGDKRRYRESSAEFYRRNPACTHRLLPWINREVVALLGNGVFLGEEVTQILMRSILKYDINGEDFRRIVQPYFSRHTDHFIHEFYNFARSCYDMEAYSGIAVYGPKPLTTGSQASTEQRVIKSKAYRRLALEPFRRVLVKNENDRKSDSSSSDCSVIDVLDSDSECDVSKPEANSNDETATAVSSINVNIGSNESSLNITLIDDFDNPRPGPSGIQFKTTINPVLEANNSSDYESEIDVGGKEDNVANVTKFDDANAEESDGSVEIITVLKPRYEQTPEIIDVSDTNEEALDEKEESSKSSDKNREKKHKHKSHHSYSRKKSKRKKKDRKRSRSWSSESSDDSNSERDSLDSHRRRKRMLRIWNSSDSSNDDSSDTRYKSGKAKRDEVPHRKLQSVVVTPSTTQSNCGSNCSERDSKSYLDSP